MRTSPVLTNMVLAISVLLLVDCASKLAIQQVAMESITPPGTVHVLITEVNATPSTGFSRPLPAGTELQRVGRLAQGDVLRPLNREVMVVGEDRHEAFVVAKGTTWNGYYLPYEKAFLPLRQPVALQWRPL
jgi:hypothetical protein